MFQRLFGEMVLFRAHTQPHVPKVVWEIVSFRSYGRTRAVWNLRFPRVIDVWNVMFERFELPIDRPVAATNNMKVY